MFNEYSHFRKSIELDCFNFGYKSPLLDNININEN